MQTKKYEVIGVVDEGAYGIVYKCRNKETNEFVAIKKFKDSEEDIVKKTMKRELKMLQQLNHENIVEFKDAFKRKGNLFLVFEYVERNLLELIQEHPKGLEPKLICSIIFQLCKAITYLNDKNIIHRDIKPENLLVDTNMVVKLCDFGFSRTYKNSNEPLTDYVATRWYRSPELLLTKGNYGSELDYWSIGCIMGELADGNPLFPGENELDQLHCIQKILGNFTDEQVELFYKNIYKGKGLMNVTNPETLERRYLGKLNKVAINFLKGLLALDPNKRLNSSNVFNHPYFDKLIDRNQNSTKNIREQKDNYNSIVSKKAIQPGIEQNGTPNNPTNITNINIINYNNYAENYSSEDQQQLQLQQQQQEPPQQQQPQPQQQQELPQQQEQLLQQNEQQHEYQKQSQPVMINQMNQNTFQKTNIKIIHKGNNSNQTKQIADNHTNILIQKPSKFLSERDASNYNQQAILIQETNQNPLFPKGNNMQITSSNFNQKEKEKENIGIPQGITNTVLDPAFQTFYKNNKERDLYNIEIDLQHCKNNENSNAQHQNNNNEAVINEADEYYPEKRKPKYTNQMYKQSNAAKKYDGEYSPNRKNTNLYLFQNNNLVKGPSPPKNYYVSNNNSKLYTGKNFHLPVIPKGSAYNSNFKKYNYFK